MHSASSQHIPLQLPSLGEEEVDAVRAVFNSRWLGIGTVVKEFEERVKELLGAKHVIAVNTGTSAIHIALDALGIGPGDEVVVPSLTFVATIQAILQTGAAPVFCDVREDTLNMDVEDARRRITPRTKALLPVHYGGQACDLDALTALCRERGLLLLEDGAHAFGSRYHGRYIGTFGDATCFSFDPIKNITCGEGGAVCTESDAMAELVRTKRILGVQKETYRRYREHRGWFYDVTTLGYRYHMSNINAAIGLCQLRKLQQFMDKKRRYVRKYDEALRGLPGVTLLQRNYDETAHFFYVVRVQNRDALMDALKDHWIDVGVHYIPNHLQPVFKPYAQPLPVTDRVWKEIVTLPLYYDMTDEIFEVVVAQVKAFLS
ncbi:MAG TPA: DegT/DnrJ/EryC1/StrS family aminotransferase [Candidatus Saccharimonadales bacterium]|nr:DegT/DnrJ/EryC1/StrS family aminotransferase [Candidatus Saccharimonadales bacterium]